MTLAVTPRHTPDCVLSNPIPRVAATAAALAVALVGLLPLAHLHADDHHQVVHRHAIGGELPHHDHGDAAGVTVDHADHSDAQALTQSYDAARQLVRIANPPASPWFLAGPGPSHLGRVRGQTLLPTHDPPYRFVSSPAPPAFG